MSAKKIVDGLFAIPLGFVNAFLLEPRPASAEEGCTLIDTGLHGKAEAVLDALRRLGKEPRAIRHILVTHAHPDHIGSLAALQKATGAETWVHPLDAEITRTGTGFRRLKPAPGLINRVMIRLAARSMGSVEAARVDHLFEDGQTLPFADGLQVIHTPGHCAGQVALLWPRHGGVLFAADACMHLMRLNWTIGYEDIAEGGRSLRKLSAREFSIACFGHGKPILNEASAHFRSKWAPQQI